MRDGQNGICMFVNVFPGAGRGWGILEGRRTESDETGRFAFLWQEASASAPVKEAAS